jgi:hypothetical protein
MQCLTLLKEVISLARASSSSRVAAVGFTAMPLRNHQNSSIALNLLWRDEGMPKG